MTSLGRIPFTKMHGLGNDYVYVDLKTIAFDPAHGRDLARRVSPRRTAIGSDGLILIGPSAVADCRMIMFNADGSRGRMCGNGARCVARYVFERWGVAKSSLTIETDSGVRAAEITVANGRVARVAVDMGAPRFDAADIPCAGTGRIIEQPLSIPGCERPLTPRITCVSMGNPHAVIFVDDLPTAPVHQLGPEIEKHRFFPEGVNVEFVTVRALDRLEMRVWERGSGETSACGTGACATLVAAAATGRSARRATVVMPGGEVDVDWRADGRVMLAGGAEFAFDGVIEA
jgi:diaminopimelate epimerase